MDLLTDPRRRIVDPPRDSALAPSVSNAAAQGCRINFHPGRSLTCTNVRKKTRANHSYPIFHSTLPSLAREFAHFGPARATNGGRPASRDRTEANRGANRRETIAQTRTAATPSTARNGESVQITPHRASMRRSTGTLPSPGTTDTRYRPRARCTFDATPEVRAVRPRRGRAETRLAARSTRRTKA